MSTSALNGSPRIEELLGYGPDLIEIYNLTSLGVSAVHDLARDHGIAVALHTPTPYDRAQPLRRYCPTGPDADEAAEARRLVAETAQHAALIGAVHVVVHYPTPYGPYDQAALDTFGPPFLAHLEDLVERYGVPILIENMSTHPLLQLPEHYAAVLDVHPRLGFCLDVGHAHLMAPVSDPVAYAIALGPRIQSLHVYNTTSARYAEHGHEMASSCQQPGDGYLDLTATTRTVLKTCWPRALVLEHGQRTTPAGAAACGRRMRSLLDEITNGPATIGDHRGE
ncbi:MAG: sugar phosphate isomerase/epimerase family protein [Dermatophilaceae bacterium]